MHAHMVSRTTADYERMAFSGCIAVTEPAFWPGFDRRSVEGFEDYFDQLTNFEPRRAAMYGMHHYAWLCLNPKEGEDRALARDVLARIPAYLSRPNVVGIGEIGLNRVTVNELATFRDHVELALDHDQLILVHTPHLEDKLKGTRIIVETLARDSRIDPRRVLIDHAEEHTIGIILANGFWCGITLYPQTKPSPQRAADMIETQGHARVCVNSACDWGASDPLAVPAFISEMRARGHASSLIERVVLANPAQFLAQSSHFAVKPMLQEAI